MSVHYIQDFYLLSETSTYYGAQSELRLTVGQVTPDS